MKKCPKPLGYGIRRTPVVLGLSAALCMPAAFSYANVGGIEWIVSRCSLFCKRIQLKVQ